MVFGFDRWAMAQGYAQDLNIVQASRVAMGSRPLRERGLAGHLEFSAD